MNSIESSMEQAIQNAGFSISSGPGPDASPQQEAPSQPEQQAQAEPQQTPEPQQQTAQPAVENIQDPTPAPTPTADEQYQATVESGSSMTNDSTDASFMDFLNALASETQKPTVQEPQATDPVQALDLDPRIQVIADFVAKTGRSPEDWFRYQALDPSEMDDYTAMRVQMASEYPSLANDEIDTLLSAKYRTDDSMFSDEEVRLAKLQLKIDAQKARASIGTLRDGYSLPVVEQSQPVAQDVESPFDAQWLQQSDNSLASLEKISFDLPGGKEFHYGVPNEYRNELHAANSNMTEYFDRYVDDQGNWDHDLWNMHRTVTDNLPTILQSIYRQGLSDGQRTIVERAANIDSKGPEANVQRQDNSIAEQVLDALGRHTPFLKKF